MSDFTILDAGPLVAFLVRRDPHHGWAVEQFRQVRPPFLTCEAAVVEACYLLRKTPTIRRGVLDLFASGDLVIAFDLNGEASAVAALMDRYANVPMSLADACLVRMTELHPTARVLTLDGDFRIYRKNGREPLDALLPEDRA